MIAVINHPPSGSLEIRDGNYALSFKHGYYQVISKTEFDAIRRQQRLVIVCFVGMASSVLIAAYLLKRAGLPISVD